MKQLETKDALAHALAYYCDSGVAFCIFEEIGVECPFSDKKTCPSLKGNAPGKNLWLEVLEKLDKN